MTSTSPPRFAHESEAELARILDYYGIEWRYEPDVFPISWNASGAVVESFAPDFYLPQVDLYVELTTLKQSLVRRKNRKLRHLRVLYPEIRVKLFYARDFKALMVKYGRRALLGELAATNGNGTGAHTNGTPGGRVNDPGDSRADDLIGVGALPK
jgi:hypoxanthine phosphoribosyltransferase